MEIIKHFLPVTFEGKGEVSGSVFTVVGVSEKALMYQVRSGGNFHYEVFERKYSPVCLDFKARIYSETEFKEVYPKSKDFGIWAWSCKTAEDASRRFAEINTREPQISND